MEQPPIRPRAVPDHPAGTRRPPEPEWATAELEVRRANAASAAAGLVVVGVVAACLLPVVAAAAGLSVLIYRAIVG